MTNQDTYFTYDARNQLVQTLQGPSGSETLLGQYDYNALGLRVRHRYSDRGDVDYYYDDGAVLEERNASDDSLLAHYRYADRLLSLDTGAALQYYHHDALGSTVDLTTEAGTVQVSYKLDPWGHIREQSGTSVNRQIFTGQEHDGNTGLIYFGARYYDPDTARFITQDSYLGESGTPPSLHRYMYAYANPTVYIDLLGYDVVRINRKTNNVEWLAAEQNGISKVDVIVIGKYKQEGFGNGQVYLTEEVGGGIVPYRLLSEAASKFNDRDRLKSVMDPQFIQGLDIGFQRTVLTAYFYNELNPHHEARISAPEKKGIINDYIFPYKDMMEDAQLVSRGVMKPIDFVMNYGYEATIGLRTAEAGGQLAVKLKKPVARVLRNLAGKFKKGTAEVIEKGIEEGVEHVDDFVEGQASGWYCEGCPSAPKKGIPQKLQGEIGEAKVRAKLKNSKTVDIVGEQVRVRTPGEGQFRVIDFLIRSKKSGKISIIEVKTGNATRSASQVAKDNLIADPTSAKSFFGRRSGNLKGTPTGPIKTHVVNADNL